MPVYADSGQEGGRREVGGAEARRPRRKAAEAGLWRPSSAWAGDRSERVTATAAFQARCRCRQGQLGQRAVRPGQPCCGEG
eukprot:scaffold2401_cov67-Phaeocystis_antarctica.AAC.9